MITAKPIVDDQFWIVEEDGNKIGVLRKHSTNKFMLSSSNGSKWFNKKSDLTKIFGKQFFESNKVKTSIAREVPKEVCGYPTRTTPCNTMINIKRNLPMFTKSESSKSLYCAGYYLIQFEKGWAKSFCPKLVTLEQYPYQGPFKTELEMKQALANDKSN